MTNQPRTRGCRYFLNLLAFTLVAVIIAAVFLQFVAHPYLYSRGFAHPGRGAVCCLTPADRGFDYENVTLTTGDGIALSGWYIPSQNGAAIILLHAHAANRLGTLDHAMMLAEAGYGVLLFDTRAHGESGGTVLTFGGDEINDVLAAVDYLQSREEVDTIGIMGLSLGAMFALRAPAHSDAIQAVIAEGATFAAREHMPPQPLNWRIYDRVFFEFLKWHTGINEPESIKDALQTVTVPVLLIGNASEEIGLQTFADLTPNSEVWIIPDAFHISGISAAPDEYRMRVTTFFDTHLLGE
jgi:uncharacterized protein